MRRLGANDVDQVEALRSRSEPFWLNLAGEGVSRLGSVAGVLGLDDAVLTDATRFGQYPRLVADGERGRLLILFGAGEPGPSVPLVEVHLLLGPDYLVTLHEEGLPSLDDLVPDPRRTIADQVVGAVIDSTFAVVEAIDDEIDEIEDQIIQRLDESQMRRLTELRRSLAAVRHVATPQRDLFLREADELSSLPGLSRAAVMEAAAHLVMVRDLVDSTRELASGALDLYLSSTSNRLNLFAERLTIVATLVLPLVVLTGFFGQNFGWLVARVDSLGAFLALGIGAPTALVAGLLLVLRRFGYV